MLRRCFYCVPVSKCNCSLQAPHLLQHQEHGNVPAAQACKVGHEAIVERLQNTMQNTGSSLIGGQTGQDAASMKGVSSGGMASDSCNVKLAATAAITNTSVHCPV